jgi:hypothetical protein
MVNKLCICWSEKLWYCNFCSYFFCWYIWFCVYTILCLYYFVFILFCVYTILCLCLYYFVFILFCVYTIFVLEVLLFSFYVYHGVNSSSSFRYCCIGKYTVMPCNFTRTFFHPSLVINFFVNCSTINNKSYTPAWTQTHQAVLCYENERTAGITSRINYEILCHAEVLDNFYWSQNTKILTNRFPMILQNWQDHCTSIMFRLTAQYNRCIIN